MDLKYLKHVKILFVISFSIFIPSMLLSFCINNDVVNYFFVLSFILVSLVVALVLLTFILYWIGWLYRKFLQFQISKDKKIT